ncbi:MAG: hypothetical protein BWK73_46520 [Thiothrix lacustris]|uniref:Bacterial Ig-like domain-containing protein n=1 Tax=Thiothrix lacustris TaxID=525917 RepID=A0A1Y1QA72_9GAMM|nr:MAG: hypothetical protein BWK73_46520 [Thiothrix lacustris]
MKQSLSLATAVLSLATSVNATQIITPTAASSEVSAGSSVVFAPRYSVTAPDNGAEAGLGLRVHFNANAVDFKSVTSPFAYGLQPIGEVTADTADFDADPTTDRYVILAWVDLTAQWPGASELPLTLGNVLFQVKSGFSGTTHLRTSASDTANGTAFQSTPMTLNIAAAAPPAVILRGLLQGAYSKSTGLMRDGLRASTLIPSTQPYASLGHSGSETTTSTLLNTTGANAPVDWVLVELCDKTTPQTRLASKAALVQADGDVVDAATGSTTLSFADVSAGTYYLALRHRNHLGMMSAAPLNLSATPTAVDFSQASTVVYGTDVRITQGAVLLLPTGDVNHDNKLIADGPSNDRNTVLGTVLSNASNPGGHTNFQLHGYYPSDLNLDGKTLYVGPDNDVNTLLANILLSPQNSTSSTNYILPGSLPQ